MGKYTEEQMQKRRDAVKRYQKTVDRINCQLPAGTAERIRTLTGKSCNAFIKETVLKELEKIERKKIREKNE